MERLQSLAYISPFHCQDCSFRFPASRLGRSYPNHTVDRREHLRIPVRLFLSFSGGKVRGEGTVLDISMGGCIIESHSPVHVDDIFYLQIALDDEQAPLEVAAMVRSVSSRGIAFKFLRAAQENKRLLAFRACPYRILRAPFLYLARLGSAPLSQSRLTPINQTT